MTTIKELLATGIHQSKIIEVNQPCVTWNLTKRRLVEQRDMLEIIDNGDGNLEITSKNNRMLVVSTYSELSTDLVKQINESDDGIIFYPSDKHFRIALIPANIPDYEDFI